MFRGNCQQFVQFVNTTMYEHFMCLNICYMFFGLYISQFNVVWTMEKIFYTRSNLLKLVYVYTQKLT